MAGGPAGCFRALGLEGQRWGWWGGGPVDVSGCRPVTSSQAAGSPQKHLSCSNDAVSPQTRPNRMGTWCAQSHTRPKARCSAFRT